jgi:hypothetical protein
MPPAEQLLVERTEGPPVKRVQVARASGPQELKEKDHATQPSDADELMQESRHSSGSSAGRLTGGRRTPPSA